MAGGWVAPAGDGVDFIMEELRKLSERVGELERPTGSQMSSNLAHITGTTVVPMELFRIDNAPSIGSSFGAEFATIDTSVPDGFTRAIVSFTASGRLRSNEVAGSWALFTLSPTIDGVAQLTNWSSASGQMYGSVTASATEVIQNLNGGDNISVGALAAFPGTYNLAQVIVSGSVLFLR